MGEAHLEENDMKPGPEIKDCMKKKVISIRMDTTVGEAVALIVKKKIGTLPVLDEDDSLVGVVTVLDMMQNFFPKFIHLLDNIDFVTDFGAVKVPSKEKLEEAGALSIADIMKEPVAVEADSSLIKCLSIMEKHDLWDLPVLEKGKLVGIASRVDIVRAFFLEWQFPRVEKVKKRA
jgi:CBS domain-containing protein